jgi:exocyst complex component 2
LTRRVREMRETRAAPVAYAPVARLRKSTTVVDAVSRAEGFVDPLGLGYVLGAQLLERPRRSRAQYIF